jgi:hypothetical protein
VGVVGAGRALAGAERDGEGVGAQGADDEPAGRLLGDADAGGAPIVGDLLTLFLDLFAAGAGGRSSHRIASRIR